MKLPNLKSCSLAVAASLGGVFLAPQAEAVNLSTDGVGEVAIAPYYTTRDGWQTLVNLTNTTQHPIAVKVRIHEAWNSRDVFDITILMSAFDNFTGLLTGSGGVPVFRSVDTDTCTAPLGTSQANPGDSLGQRQWALDNYAYGGGTNPAAARESDGGPTDIDRLREGYVEFLVMGHYTNLTGAANGTGNDVVRMSTDENGDKNDENDSPGELIEAHDCAALDTMFSSRANVLEAAQFAGEPINALKFNYRLINVGRGVEAGGSATTWTNFFNPGPNAVDGEVLSGDGPDDLFGIDPDPNLADSSLAPGLACTVTRGAERSTATTAPGTIEWNPDTATAADAASGQGSCLNLITAQTTFDFLEPTLNDAFPVVANGWVDRYNNELEAMNPMDPALVAEGRTGSNTVFPEDANLTGSIRGIDAVSLTIQRSAVINEWAFNTDASGGVATDWIVTFPTKTFYVDQDGRVNSGAAQLPSPPFGQQAGLVAGDRDEAYYTTGPGGAVANGNVIDVPYAPFRQAFITLSAGPPVVVNTNDTGSCVGVQYNVYDREQNTMAASGASIPSPAPPVPGEDICYEANVLQFNGGDVLGSKVSNNVVVGGGLGANGWMHLSFTDAVTKAANAGAIGLGSEGGLLGWSGLPVTGFVVKQRTVGSVSGNYASSMDHGYRRMCEGSSGAWANAATCPAVLAIDPN